MKIVVFGSTGNVGQQLVKQAIELGHDVTAHTRTPTKLDQTSENLKIIKGDILDPSSVKKAIEGQEVVMCALGMPLMNKDGLRAKGTKNIVTAMEEIGVRRLVCLSSLGTGDSFNILPFYYRFFLAPLLMRHLFADHGAQESLIKSSKLDWTIARPGSFVKGPATDEYRHGFFTADTSLKLKISHGDVANFMLKQLDDNTYLHQTPGLSY
ncbi:MAG: SDR family oxidoreductase [Rhodospirillales bacterium]|nr:SDR family oxidoreductase [Rhodospirillales bacterium]